MHRLYNNRDGKATILEKRMDDILWPKIVFAMTHIKNLRPTQILEGSMSSAKMRDNNLPNFHYLCVLSSIVYVFFYKEEYILKSAKWDVRALKRKLVEFDRHTIYRVHTKDQNKVIRGKDL